MVWEDPAHNYKNGFTVDVSHPNHAAVLHAFLSELSFWEPPTMCTTNEVVVVTNNNNNRKKDGFMRQTAPPVWKTAVDPRSGQTYYYDAVTRQTQWEKPKEIRQAEKQARKEKRRLDRIFFREMERNILRSLARGQLIPGDETSTVVVKQQEEKEQAASTDNSSPRVRTISGMDNVLLQQLQHKPPTSTAESATSNTALARPHVIARTTSTEGRPPRPSRGRAGSSHNPANDSLDLSSDESVGSLSKKQQLARHDSNESASEQLAGEFLLDEGSSSSSPVKPNPSLPKPSHVRRNTGGTIFVKSTMASPNVEATIKCVCGVFRAHILQALKRQTSGSPPSVAYSHQVDVMTIFEDDYGNVIPNKAPRIPSLADICSFYQDFYNRSQMEHDTIIMSLIYVERLIKEAGMSPTPKNWMSILFSCMVLASKVWDDLSMWNVDFSHVCGKKGTWCFSSFTLGRINQLELALLKLLNFNVKVPASEYAKYYFLIRSMLLKSGLLEEVTNKEVHHTLKPLDMQGAKNLETLSSNYQETFQSSSASEQANRRSKSMDGYFWFHQHQQQQAAAASPEARQPTSSSTTASCGNSASGPVLKQSVCLEQLVSM